MTQQYQHLGIFSDWVQAAREQQPLFPVAPPGPETQRRVREVLGFCNGPETPRDVQIEQRWQRDGLIGEEVSWSVGYGPRTHAYVLKPVHANQSLPGIIALHCHGGFKFYGKEKIADGLTDPPPVLIQYRQNLYAGRAFANALAQAGFVVLVPDIFMWGSRKFPFVEMPEPVQDITAAALKASPPDDVTPFEIAQYNAAAYHHEHWVAKYCNILGTSLAGVVSYEDRIAVNYLLSRADVIPNRIGCIGLSGGGNRAALLNATHEQIGAAVIVGLMSTYEELLDHNMSHTWMLLPFGWSRYGDWPDLAACRAPSPLLVQYNIEDELFTKQGMQDADARLKKHYSSVGNPGGYVGQFYPGPHKFDLEMQAMAQAVARIIERGNMEYTHLGRTGLLVSRFCLGTMAFGREADEPTSVRIMDRALKLGVNFFDTANRYGQTPGVTEEIIGRWLAQSGGRREKIVLATKCYGSMGDGPNDRGLSAYHIRRACEDSLRRLQTDHIDLYQMHHVDRAAPWDEIWQAMEQLVLEGKVLYVGSSNFAAWHIAQAQCAASARNFLGLVSEQSRYSLAIRTIELEVIPACRALGIGILPYGPLRGGILAGGTQEATIGRRSSEGARELFEKHKTQIDAYEALCHNIGVEPAHVAHAWLLQRPGVTAPILGPRTVEQLEHSVKSAEVKLSEEVMTKLDAIWSGPGEAPESYAW